MGIGVLGPLQVDGDLHLGPRDRVVLAALAARPGQVISPDQLADAVWGERPPRSWAKNLQGCVSRLRKSLGMETIETSSQGYRLGRGTMVDVQTFEAKVFRARELLALGEPELAGYTASEALRLWRGPPLTELEDWEPAAAEVSRLTELQFEAEELQLDAALRAGHHREVQAQAQAMVDRAPLREQRWALLALAQYQGGRQADALRTLHRIRVILNQELGLDPGPDIRRLEQAILTQDPTLLVAPSAGYQATRCPYLGLTPYDERDADAFFGRDREVTSALERLRSAGTITVVGPSGSGKSSLVRAGIAPALRRSGHDVAVVTPGLHPLDAASVLSGHQSGTWIVDQAEEIFSLCEDASERAAFLELLATHARTSTLVIGLRADRMGDLVAYPAFARLAERGLFLLGPLPAADLRAAIEGPARQAGLLLEPGLVDLLVREVEGEPGALPLLSHALRETWLRREGRTLTVTGYQSSGGIRGAVAQSAEELYASVGQPERRLLRDLLLRLVLLGEAGEPVRHRVSRRQIVADPRQDELVDQLVGSRLVTSDDGVVELAHEAVARAWPRLRGWLDEDREGQHLLHHLTQSAEDWARLDRPDSELYRGARLAAAVEWMRSPDHPALTALEEEFIDASAALAVTEERSAADQARAQGRMIRRLRGTLAAAAVLLALALVAGALAIRQAGRASDAAAVAQARQLSAQALSSDDITLAALLAVEAVRLDDSPETRASLSAVLAQHPALLATSAGLGGVGGLDVSPDGRTTAVYTLNNLVDLIDNRTGRVEASYDIDGPDVSTPAFAPTSPLSFSPDGRVLAVAAQAFHPPTLRLVDGHTLRVLPAAEQPGHQPKLRAKGVTVAFSADGRYLAGSFMLLAPDDHRPGVEDPARSETLVWDLAHPARRPQRVEVPAIHMWEHMAISPDGSRVYVSAPLTAYDVRSGKRLWQDRSLRSYQPLDLSSDGRLLATSSGGGLDDVALVDTRQGRVVKRLTQPSEAVTDLAFSRDGTRLAAIAGHVYVWDVASGSLVQDLTAGDASGVGFSPDGKLLHVGDFSEGHLTTWDLTGSSSFLRRLPVDAEIPNGFARPAPDGRHVVVYGTGEMSMLDVDTGSVSAMNVTGTNAAGSGAWRGDSRRFATSGGGVVSVYDAHGRLLRRHRVSNGMIMDLDYSADGRTLEAGDLTGRLRLVDATGLRPAGPVARLPGPVGSSQLSPDGRTAFVVTRARHLEPGEDFRFNEWATVDTRSGRVLRRGRFPFLAYFADISPDGRKVAVTSSTGQLLVLDLSTGRAVRPPVQGHRETAYWLAWSADGKHLLTTATDGTVDLWNARTVAVENTVTLPSPVFNVAQFRPDSHDVLIVDQQGRAYLWDTRRRHAIDFACKVAGRELTADEWHTYLGDTPQQPVCPT